MTSPVTPVEYIVSARTKAQSPPWLYNIAAAKQRILKKGRPHVAYRNKHGITNIIPGRFKNLDVSWGTETEENTSPRYRQPILLFTPDMKKTSHHFHIWLTTAQATTLHKWLKAYLDHVASDPAPKDKAGATMKFRAEPEKRR
ncbi:MAG: hypothetical protein EOO38_14200 [Cytophagaceae bacterium]|nr:MAG: hypothetical protein EOO38_14200 [Cytophagaceae bacterium]